ncbi:MAG: hypothetical protein A2908_01425 [Candidatus Staskawiczbacteria bacterium RIFCSPLOWO2_01_FULL_38_12b]|uniref:Uncharacterized protein n=1 Tax=Candidatus Staskawiczbacteria bacterium RIFCSPLOWO2_01_FULL_38_12b TaxID=1802214 RepID=A0A1G2ICR2_9BACT|nr:MAG: hypothetical protein A2908_01425 [Candidatus Staskawiczbacteria bacterium RIFCSPLOWO2_01_FULL_38_12b]
MALLPKNGDVKNVNIEKLAKFFENKFGVKIHPRAIRHLLAAKKSPKKEASEVFAPPLQRRNTIRPR